MLTPGNAFGAYLVEAPVGQGGMGAVYRARDSKLGRLVALKVMLPEDAGDEESVARFLREAKLAAALEHPGIVRIYEVGTISGMPYIAMEWIEGKTLRVAKVRDPRALLRGIAEILAFAHEHGVIHRDLKPANVMVDANGAPKLVDFGIAKRLASATFATREGMVLGTPRYMAPEQEVSSAVDARADQYAWGVLAYELLTGEKPSRPALAHAALDEKDAGVVMRSLSVAPADRFASMRELLAAWNPGMKPAAEPGAVMTPFARLFLLSVVGAVIASGIAMAAVVIFTPGPAKPSAPEPESAPPIASTPLPDVPDATAEVLPELSASASASASSVVVASTTATARGPRLVQHIDVTVRGLLNVDWESVKVILTPGTLAGLRRCFAGVPYRASDPEYAMRVWLKDDGTVDSTSATAQGFNPDGWPGRTARTCLNGVISPLRFKMLSDGGSFVLDFVTK